MFIADSGALRRTALSPESIMLLSEIAKRYYDESG
jgi:hypothetical protein